MTRQTRGGQKRIRGTARPGLEVLEAGTVPAVFTVNSTDNGDTANALPLHEAILIAKGRMGRVITPGDTGQSGQ